VDGGGVFMLSPKKDEAACGNLVDALRSTGFIERFDPKYVCLLPGDQIYRMDYSKMLDAHKRSGADVTVASAPICPDAGRHGTVTTDERGAIVAFRHSAGPHASSAGLPATRGDAGEAGHDLASMGVQIFSRDAFSGFLDAGERDAARKNFDAAVPTLLASGQKLYAYRHEGYWRDPETAEDLWESHMDLLRDPFILQGNDALPSSAARPCCFVRGTGTISHSILSGLQVILGKVEHSILSDSVVVEEGAEVVDSVLMPNVYVGKNAKVRRAIVGPNSHIMDDAEIGGDRFASPQCRTDGVSLIASWARIAGKTKLPKNSHVENGVFIDSHAV
jgi:glucose-1-phosphate adenylyltransferase